MKKFQETFTISLQQRWNNRTFAVRPSDRERLRPRWQWQRPGTRTSVFITALCHRIRSDKSTPIRRQMLFRKPRGHPLQDPISGTMSSSLERPRLDKCNCCLSSGGSGLNDRRKRLNQSGYRDLLKSRPITHCSVVWPGKTTVSARLLASNVPTNHLTLTTTS